MTRRHSWRRILQVRPGEERRLWFVAGFFVLTQAGHGLSLNMADALFFRRFGVENLPYMFMALGLATLVATLAYSAGFARFNRRRYLVAVYLGIVCVLIVERLVAAGGARATFAVIWVSTSVILIITYTAMWNVASEVFDTRQAKRLFPVLASAGILGGVAGNFLTAPLTALLGTTNLLLVQGILLTGAAWFAHRTGAQFFRPRRAVSVSPIEQLRGGYRLIRRSPLLRLVAFAAPLLSLLFLAVLFPFSQAVAERFTEEAELAGFLGFFSGAVTALAFLISLLLAGRLYARLGLVGALLILPVVYVGAFAIWMVEFGFQTAVAVRAMQWLTSTGVALTAFNALFNVAPADRRGEAFAFVNAVPAQVGVVAAGVWLLAGQHLLSQSQTFLGGLLLSGLLLILVLLMRSRYRQALMAGLRAGTLNVFDQTSGSLSRLAHDGDATRAAVEAMSDERLEVRRAAAQVLAAIGGPAAQTRLRAGLNDPDPEVRLAAIAGWSGDAGGGGSEVLESLMEDEDPRVRAAAVAAVGRLATTNPATLSVIAADPNPMVRARAAGALARTGDRQGATLAIERLASSRTIDDRLAGLGAASEVPGSLPIGDLRSHLHDSTSSRVRVGAVNALAALDSEQATRILLEATEDLDEHVRLAAASALSARPEAVDLLVEALYTGSERSKHAVLAGLKPYGHRVERRVVEWALEQIPRARDFRRAGAVLSAHPSEGCIGFLAQLIADREWQVERRVLSCLAVIGSPRDVDLIERGLAVPDAERRAQAIEALDTLPDQELSAALVPLLEAEPSDPDVTLPELLVLLTADFDPWVRALALRGLDETEWEGRESVFRAARGSIDEVVAETASVALARMQGDMTLETFTILDKLLALRQVPLFAGLPPQDLDQVAAIAEEAHFIEGAYLFRQGDEGDEMFVIIEGAVEVRAHSSDQDDHRVAVRRAGEHVGELALLRQEPRSADVIAHEGSVRSLTLSRRALERILLDRPGVAVRMLGTLADRLSDRI
ncbi:MAG: HEAT repeat domain-containing protein [Acidimicrobiia bacterium]